MEHKDCEWPKFTIAEAIAQTHASSSAASKEPGWGKPITAAAWEQPVFPRIEQQKQTKFWNSETNTETSSRTPYFSSTHPRAKQRRGARYRGRHKRACKDNAAGSHRTAPSNVISESRVGPQKNDNEEDAVKPVSFRQTGGTIPSPCRSSKIAHQVSSAQPNNVKPAHDPFVSIAEPVRNLVMELSKPSRVNRPVEVEKRALGPMHGHDSKEVETLGMQVSSCLLDEPIVSSEVQEPYEVLAPLKVRTRDNIKVVMTQECLLDDPSPAKSLSFGILTPTKASNTYQY